MGDESCPPAKPRRIRLYAILALVVLVGLSLLATLTSSPQPDAQPAPSLPAGTVLTPTDSTATSAPTVAPPRAGFAPTGPTERGTVTRVVDGDTLVVEIDGGQARLRYIGMDTPEPDASDADLRASADAATEANRALVDGRDVVLERDVSETDRYDRLLRNVWVQDQNGTLVMVGLELVRTGFAQVSTYPPDVKYVDLLRVAQDEARAAGVGLWASQGSIAPAPTKTPAPIQGLVGQGAFDDPWGFDIQARHEDHRSAQGVLLILRLHRELLGQHEGLRRPVRGRHLQPFGRSTGRLLPPRRLPPNALRALKLRSLARYK